VLRAIVEQHAEEAAFLWLAREAALAAPSTRLEDLMLLDERLSANLDGLRIAGEPGAKLVLDALDHGEAGEVFAAGVLACDRAAGDRFARVVDAASTEDLASALAGALGWLPFRVAEPALIRLRSDPRSLARGAAIRGRAAHRRDDKGAIDAALLDDDPRLHAVAFRAVGELGRRDRSSALEVGAQADARASRYWAAWSASLLGDRRGPELLAAIAAGGGELGEAAATFAASALPPDVAKTWFDELAQEEGLGRVAVRAAASLGDPAVIPILLGWLEVPELGRVAADAITTITGIAIEGELAGAAPPDFEAGPSDEPDDDDLALDPDAGLAWPRAAEVRAAWARHEGEHSSGVRHLFGRPLNRDALLRALALGRQPERARAAFEIARAGEPLFDVAAPARRQLRALEELGIEPPTLLGSYA
jgi:uncharacterized protein (TIGR02270 family)